MSKSVNMTLKAMKATVAGEGRIIVVIGDNNCWGRGVDGAAAYKAAHMPKGWLVYDCPPNTYVNNFGQLNLAAEHCTPELIAAYEASPYTFFRKVGGNLL